MYSVCWQLFTHVCAHIYTNHHRATIRNVDQSQYHPENNSTRVEGKRNESEVSVQRRAMTKATATRKKKEKKTRKKMIWKWKVTSRDKHSPNSVRYVFIKMIHTLWFIFSAAATSTKAVESASKLSQIGAKTCSAHEIGDCEDTLYVNLWKT